jgi:uncharacterized protein with GYD domain
MLDGDADALADARTEEVVLMPKYAILFSLTSDTMARFLENPDDRRGPVSQLAEGVGGRLEAYYWMFGQYDGLTIVEAPDSDAAACVAMAVTSSGAFTKYETHELIEADNLVRIAERAKTLRASYRPPGSASG